MKRNCPDCETPLAFRFLLRPWWCVLRYWRCPNCRERFVTQGNGSVEEAA